MKNASSILILLIFFSQIVNSQEKQKNRVIILTDVENEPDDSESLVRLLVYSNVIDIKGIIATTSVHMKNEVHPESIKKVILAYGKIQPNLSKHEAGFPEAGSLLQVVKQGLPEYGMGGVGNGRDSEGSDWIIKILDENDPRPLWICVWGGPNTLAQALYRIRQTRSEADVKRLIGILRVYTISDQDDSGIWMRKNFPDLFYIVSPGGYGGSTWSAINTAVTGLNNEAISNPVPALGHPHQITVKSGENFVLDASGTSDPDGDNLSYLWFQYPEAGSYEKIIPINLAENLYRIPRIKAPAVDKPEMVHFILKVTDKGNTPLTRYKRVIVNITPE